MSKANPTIMSCKHAIGVFDSGIGGITVLQHLQELMPAEHYIYYADSAHAPYGGKDSAFIIERTLAIADALVQREVKALVVACNTATAAAIDVLRARYELPIVGIEPAIKPALTGIANGPIGVMATVNTLASDRFKKLLQRYAGEHRVISLACPGLVECVESGEWQSEATRQLVKRYVDELLGAKVQAIVLGCTHYPFLMPMIKELTDHRLPILEPAPAIAKRTKQLLIDHNRVCLEIRQGHTEYLCSGDLVQTRALIETLPSLAQWSA